MSPTWSQYNTSGNRQNLSLRITLSEFTSKTGLRVSQPRRLSTRRCSRWAERKSFSGRPGSTWGRRWRRDQSPPPPASPSSSWTYQSVPESPSNTEQRGFIQHVLLYRYRPGQSSVNVQVHHQLSSRSIMHLKPEILSDFYHVLITRIFLYNRSNIPTASPAPWWSRALHTRGGSLQLACKRLNNQTPPLPSEWPLPSRSSPRGLERAVDGNMRTGPTLNYLFSMLMLYSDY